MSHIRLNTLKFFLIIISLPLLNSACKKTIVENPFADVITLDCRSLIIREVEFKKTIIELTIENTCKNCTGWPVYQGIAMINRQNISDTLAQTSSMFSLSPPGNGMTLKYELNTTLLNLPDLKTVQFDFSLICRDITYLPK